jgi:hypothetical protein
MVRPIDKAPVYLSLEEVAVCVGRNILVEVDGKSVLIVGNLQGILGWQVRPYPIQ